MYNFKTIKNAKGKTNHFFSTFSCSNIIIMRRKQA